MPRIAVAVVVFALIVFSIGFNTARYSVVWEMVGESPRLFQPGQASHSAAVAKPESIAQSAASWNSAAGEVPPQDPTGEDFHRDSWWVEDDL